MGSLKDCGHRLPAPLRGEACVAASCPWREDAASDVVAKIDPNAVDVVTSRAWGVPLDDGGPCNAPADDDGERAVRMRFRPSIWIEDDEDLAHDVDALLSDVERWAGVGSLSDMVSPTSAPSKDGRAAFWDEAMTNGLEADHGCGDMLARMTVRPGANESSGRHRGAELVLNPDGRMRPRWRAGSAANSACVLSLLAGLAVHPRVVSVGVVGAPFPAQAALNATQIVEVPRYL